MTKVCKLTFFYVKCYEKKDFLKAAESGTVEILNKNARKSLVSTFFFFFFFFFFFSNLAKILLVAKDPNFLQTDSEDWIDCANEQVYLSLRKHAYLNILKISSPKTENFQIKNSDIFHISAPNIDCGYSLEPPRRGGSNECPQSMFFLAEIRKIIYTPVNPSFTI